MYTALDVPKQGLERFTWHLTQDRTSWFLEMTDGETPVGLVYFTHVIPHVSAMFNVVTWDGKMPKPRVEAMRRACQLAAERFSLERIGMQIKWSNRVMKDVLKRIGMTYEGTIRKGWVDAKGIEDALLFGVIKEEL